MKEITTIINGKKKTYNYEIKKDKVVFKGFITLTEMVVVVSKLYYEKQVSRKIFNEVLEKV